MSSLHAFVSNELNSMVHYRDSVKDAIIYAYVFVQQTVNRRLVWENPYFKFCIMFKYSMP